MMSAISPVLEGSLARLRARRVDEFYRPEDSCDAMRAFTQALCKFPQGQRQLTACGELLGNRTAPGTPYALIWSRGMDRVKHRYVTPKVMEVGEEIHSSEGVSKRTVLKEQPHFLRALQTSSQQKWWWNELKGERDRIRKLLDESFGYHLLEGARKSLEDWLEADNNLISEGENYHVDGCRFLLLRHRGGLEARKTAVVEDRVYGSVWAREVQAAAGFLMGQLAAQPPAGWQEDLLGRSPAAADGSPETGAMRGTSATDHPTAAAEAQPDGQPNGERGETSTKAKGKKLSLSRKKAYDSYKYALHQHTEAKSDKELYEWICENPLEGDLANYTPPRKFKAWQRYLQQALRYYGERRMTPKACHTVTGKSVVSAKDVESQPSGPQARQRPQAEDPTTLLDRLGKIVSDVCFSSAPKRLKLWDTAAEILEKLGQPSAAIERLRKNEDPEELGRLAEQIREESTRT